MKEYIVQAEEIVLMLMSDEDDTTHLAYLLAFDFGAESLLLLDFVACFDDLDDGLEVLLVVGLPVGLVVGALVGAAVVVVGLEVGVFVGGTERRSLSMAPRKFTSGPMCSLVSPSCANPVSESSWRTSFGFSGAPNACMAMP